MTRIDFENPNGTEYSGRHSGRLKAGEWKKLEGIEGVRFKEWQLEGVNGETFDGAFVEMRPGFRTHVQYVESDHYFEEDFQKGKFLVIKIDKENDLVVYKYDADSMGMYMTLQAEQGEIMCIYALKDNEVPGEVIESETPGFSSAELVTVPDNAEQIGDLKIPRVFWDLIHKLDRHDETDLPVEVVDLAEEFGE